MGGALYSGKSEEGDKTLLPNHHQNLSSFFFGLRVAIVNGGGQIRDELLGIKWFLIHQLTLPAFDTPP